MSGRRAPTPDRIPALRKRYQSAVVCGRKIRYETWAEAEAVCRIHAQRDHRLVLAHRCRWCDGWHIAKPVSWMRSPCNDPVRSLGIRALDKGY